MVMGGRRRRRWAIAAAAVLLVLAAAATFGPALLNLERYRTQMARQVGRAIGRDVSVGAVTASLWRLGADVQGIQVAERPGYGAAPFLEADALRVRVELLPLLRGQFRVATAVLERPRIHLVRDREGRWNFEDLWPAAGPAAGAPGRPAPDAPEGHRAPRAGAAGILLVRDLRARGGELRIDDLRGGRAGGAAVAVGNLRLDVRQQSEPREGVTIALAGTVAGGALEAAATLAPRGAALALVDGRATLKHFDLAALGPYLGKEGVAGPADLSIAGKGSLPGAGLDLSGNLDLTKARLDLGGPARKATGEEGRLTFAGRLKGDGPALGLDLPKVALKWRGMTADGRLSISCFQPLEMTFAAETPRVDLDQLLLLPPQESAPAKGGAAKRKTSRGPGLLGAAIAHAASGGEAPQGGGRGAKERPAAPAVPRPAAAAPGGGAPAPTPVRADGTLRAAAVRWRGLEAQDVQAALAYRDGVLTVKDLKGGLAGGKLAASGSADLRGRYPALAVAYKLEQAQLQPLVAAAPKRDPKLEAHGVLTTEGKIAAPALVPGDGNALGALVGSGSLVIRDGRLVGYKPLERLSSTLGSLQGGGLLKTRLDQFDRLTGTFTLDKGFLRTKDLLLVRPDGQATAAGSLNLLDTALDFDVTARFGKVSAEAKVLGTTREPVVVPNVARLDKRFELEIDRALKGDRGKGVRDLLKDLFR